MSVISWLSFKSILIWNFVKDHSFHNLKNFFVKSNESKIKLDPELYEKMRLACHC